MRTSLRVMLILFGVSLLASAVTGRLLYSRFAYLWLVLLVGNWVWARLTLRRVTFNRKVRQQRAQVGQVFEERFEIRNPSRLPILWLEVQDNTSLPGARGSRVLALIGGKQGRSYISRTRLVQRGVFTLGPTELVSGDPFGLFQINQTIPAEGSVYVFPTLIDVFDFPDPPGLLPGGEALRRKTHQVTPNAAGVREYSPGDPLSRIHWLSTARRDRLMVKDFELDPLAEVWIFIDAAQDVQAAMPFDVSTDVEMVLLRPFTQIALPPATEEYAVSIAASIAKFYLNQGRAVGLITDGQTLDVLPPDRSLRQFGKILEVLTVLQAKGKTSFPTLVSSRAKHLPRGSTVVLITPSADQEVAWCTEQLIRLDLRPLVVLLDVASFGREVETDSLMTSLRGLNVPLCFVKNGDDLEAALNIGKSFDGSPKVSNRRNHKIFEI